MPNQTPFVERALSSGQIHLRLLATTDLHAHVMPYDYFGDQPSQTGGLARAAPLIEALRDEAPNTLLLENGDLIQGTPLGDFVAQQQSVSPEHPHPIVSALNVLKYDAGTVGNHELNYGLEFAQNTMDGAAHPVVLSNVYHTGKDSQPFAPYALLQRDMTDGAGNSHSLTIGVIGFTPPQILNWDRALLHGRVDARDIVETAKELVPRLKADGADIIIALCHSGIGPDEWAQGQENAAVPLGAVPGIDAMILGHTHKVFPGPDHNATTEVDPERGSLHGTPAVMSGFWGSHVGQIDLLLERQSGWAVTDFFCAAKPAATMGATVSAPLTEALTKAHHGTLDYIRRPIGHSDQPMHGYFAMVSEASTLRLVQQAQTMFLEQAVAGTADAALPILSAACPFKAGGPAGPKAFSFIPGGPLALKHAFELYPFPNSFAALRVTGAVLQEWLERAAGAFAQVTPGAQDGALLDAVYPSYDFDVISGVDYQIDLSQPCRYAASGALANPNARRISDLSHNGRAVAPDQEFLVATHSYRVGGGGSFVCLEDAEVAIEETKATLEILVDYIDQAAASASPAGSHWGFKPMPGTSVVFDTGPDASSYLDGVAHLQLTDLGLQSSGFRRFRLAL